MAISNVNEDDWVSVPDETQSAQAIADLRAQLQTSRDMAKEFATRMTKLQMDFDALREEVFRVQGVDDLVKSQKQALVFLQNTCNTLTTQGNAADKKAENQKQKIDGLQQTNRDLAERLSAVEKSAIIQKQKASTLQKTCDNVAVKVATSKEKVANQEHTVEPSRTARVNLKVRHAESSRLLDNHISGYDLEALRKGLESADRKLRN